MPSLANQLLLGGFCAGQAVTAVIGFDDAADYFKIDAQAGALSAVMSTNPSWQSFGRSNLYAKLQLFNSKNVLLASIAPAVPTSTTMRLDFNLPAQGSYFLAVVKSGFGDPRGDGFSSYGSVGGCARASLLRCCSDYCQRCWSPVVCSWAC